MTFFRCAAIVAAVVVSAALPAVVRADASMGQLVYNFTYSANQSITARDSANSLENPSEGGGLAGGSNSGESHYAGNLTDKGTMTVEIVKKQPDGTLVVTISEQGENTRRAPAAECVVYGNTHVLCDPNKTVYTEEYTLLRFLGANFVNPSQLDASRHWSIVENSGDGMSVQADYTINSNNSGIMQIGEKRSVKESGAGHLTTDIETKIGYDFTRSVPTSVDEYATQYTDSGLNGTSRTTYQTTLQLVSDTMAKT
ncbi:MAG TPA: hypothetical protein VFF63_04080 [Candidatus Babeliales bacterium]|nr:hypothetical protein [Candidatus Babeliales bacterium]